MIGFLGQALLFVITISCTIVYLLFSCLKRVTSHFRPSRWNKRVYESQMKLANSYDRWKALAKQLDAHENRNRWKKDSSTHLFDFDAINARLNQLRAARADGDVETAMLLLRENMVRNIAGIGKPELYNYCNYGTKDIIISYTDEVCKLIDLIANDPHLNPRSVEQFLADSRQAFGRSALFLSGHTILGMYHWGVIKGLYEQNVLPQVICGSAIGALFAALLGVHTNDKLGQLLNNPNSIDLGEFDNLAGGSGKRKITRLLKHGVLMDIEKLEKFCRANLGDLTFKEAYERTGRIINITLTHTTHSGCPSLLNYLTTPNVLLWSAACASCSQPGLYAPVPLLGKNIKGRVVILYDTKVRTRWSLNTTVVHPQLPTDRLAELFNVNHFIVSQASPHVLPFLRTSRSSSRFNMFHKMAMFGFSEIAHLSTQIADIGYWPKSWQWLRMEIMQPYEGDITIVPPLSLETVLNILSNPTREMLEYYQEKGLKATFPVIYQIQVRCQIEKRLQEAIVHIRQRIRAMTEIFDETIKTSPSSEHIAKKVSSHENDEVSSNDEEEQNDEDEDQNLSSSQLSGLELPARSTSPVLRKRRQRRRSQSDSAEMQAISNQYSNSSVDTSPNRPRTSSLHEALTSPMSVDALLSSPQDQERMLSSLGIAQPASGSSTPSLSRSQQSQNLRWSSLTLSELENSTKSETDSNLQLDKSSESL